MAGRGQSTNVSPFSGSAQDAENGYKGRLLGGSHTNLERLNEGSTEYHGLLCKPQTAPVECGPDGVGTFGQQSHEGEAAGVYLGRLSAPRFSSGSLHDMEQDVQVTPPSQTTVPRLNNPEDAAIKTAYRGRLSSCSSAKNSWNVASHVEAL